MVPSSGADSKPRHLVGAGVVKFSEMDKGKKKNVVLLCSENSQKICKMAILHKKGKCLPVIQLGVTGIVVLASVVVMSGNPREPAFKKNVRLD